MMVQDKSIGSRTFDILNSAFLAIIAILCLAPFIHILAVSFSDKSAAAANRVLFWPIGFHVAAYREILKSIEFLRAFMISVARTIVGTSLNMLLTVLAAYPLSMEPSEFKGRNFFMWVMFFTMLFSGGLIPQFMLIRSLGLFDSFWVLILPGAFPVFNAIILMNFFRRLPRSLYESAMMDGASHWTILFRIYLPLSLPSLATLTLFCMVGHWNEWFSGLIYMNNPANYPLQTYLRQVLLQLNYEYLTEEDIKLLAMLSNRTLKAAQIFITAFPILCVYPFLQKYFIKGLVLGAIKE